MKKQATFLDYLQDILDAIISIKEFLEDVDYESFRKDKDRGRCLIV